MSIALLRSLFMALCWLVARVVTATPAATFLQKGDIQIVAYASDNPDAFAFVTWVEIEVGTEIYFTDKGWDCNGFVTGESVIQYTAPEVLPPGSVRSYQNGETNDSGWNIVSGSVIISIYGDQLIVYQGSMGDPHLIYAFDNTGGWESCETVASKKSRHSALPEGLVDGESAVTFAHSDNFWYRPWYATSGTLTTLKQWMVNRNRFLATSTNSRRADEYRVPESFSILESGSLGSSTYTEYIPGTAPCLLLASHDGDVYPDSIADRKHGCYDAETQTCDWHKDCVRSADESLDATNCRAVTLNDENTQDMARRANDMVRNKFPDSYCHLVVNRLGRIKLDPNREEEQGAQFDRVALEAYHEFHAFATLARDAITNSFGRGLMIDFHGHAHPEAKIELGYKIWSSRLRKTDEELDAFADDSSVRNLVAESSSTSLSEVLRGPLSMGALLEDSTGDASVPSVGNPHPLEGESYFSGGYNTEVHGSRDSGSVDAIQIEFPRHLRADNWEEQTDLLTAFAEVVLPQYLEHFYGFSF